MKYFALFFFLVPFIHSFAQTKPFEGIITWNVTTEVIDSRDVEQYQKDIIREDYAKINQAIKELEDQLIDPEMQNLLLENPTIKSNMQKRLKELKDAQAENLDNPDN